MTEIKQPTTTPVDGIGEELTFSHVPGYRLRDFNYACPTTGQPCEEKLRLISSYTRDIDQETVERGDADMDVRKLQVKLGEYSFRGRTVTCEEAQPCAVRQQMNQSPTRRTLVQAFRTVRDRVATKNLIEEDDN